MAAFRIKDLFSESSPNVDTLGKFLTSLINNTLFVRKHSSDFNTFELLNIWSLLLSHTLRIFKLLCMFKTDTQEALSGYINNLPAK